MTCRRRTTQRSTTLRGTGTPLLLKCSWRTRRTSTPRPMRRFARAPPSQLCHELHALRSARCPAVDLASDRLVQNTPLHLAAIFGHAGAGEALVKVGAPSLPRVTAAGASGSCSPRARDTWPTLHTDRAITGGAAFRAARSSWRATTWGSCRCTQRRSGGMRRWESSSSIRARRSTPKTRTGPPCITRAAAATPSLCAPARSRAAAPCHVRESVRLAEWR